MSCRVFQNLFDSLSLGFLAPFLYVSGVFSSFFYTIRESSERLTKSFQVPLNPRKYFPFLLTLFHSVLDRGGSAILKETIQSV